MLRNRLASGFVGLMALASVHCLHAQSALGVYDAQGKFVGLYAGASTAPFSETGLFAATTTRGYQVIFRNEGNQFTLFTQAATFDGRRYAGVLFSLPNCEGPSYTQLVEVNPPLPAGYRGSAAIFRENAPGGLTEFWAVAHSAQVVSLIPQSRRSNNVSQCESVTPNPINAVPVQLNDPNVTGLPNPPLVGPYRIEPVPLSQAYGLFRDGFESAAASTPSESTIA